MERLSGLGKKSVVAGCAVFCNGFAPFGDEWVRKSEVRKRKGIARRTVFCKGFVLFMVEREKGKCALYFFLQWFLYT